ncbi:protein translocase subunit SecF [Candidatus Woesearchaeota archaeon]|nr:protein translocase subunit SecF [Candidatus Woesearchaeota archaeon]
MGKSRRERRLAKFKKGKYHLEPTDLDAEEKPEQEAPKETAKKEYRNAFDRIYTTQYKKLVFIPITLLLIAFILIGINIVTTGDFMNKGVSLKGGITLTIPTEQEISVAELDSFLNSQFLLADIGVREVSEFRVQTGVIIEASDLTEQELLSATKEFLGDFGDSYSIETIGPSLGESFFRQTIIAVLLALLFMGMVVFWYFRTLVPSAAVILAAFSDIVITIAIVDIIGMKVSTAGVAAFLMLIGYSVDTNILLSTRVLKRKEGNLMTRVYSALKTGLTMNGTTIVAVIVALIVSDSEVIKQIMTIILIGLIIDMINTWIQNVSILRYYLERKGAQ